MPEYPCEMLSINCKRIELVNGELSFDFDTQYDITQFKTIIVNGHVYKLQEELKDGK